MKYLYFLLFISLTSLTGCQKGGDSQPSAPSPAPQGIQAPSEQPLPAPLPIGEPQGTTSSTTGALAKVGDYPITDAEVSERVKDQLARVESQIYEIKKEGLDVMIEEKLLEMEAAKRKVSVDELLKAEVDKKMEEPTESEIDTFYNIYKKRMKNKPLSEVKDDLVKQIKSNKKASLYAKFMGELKKDAKVEIYMKRPRIEVSVDDDPSQGNPKAPVTLIEFSDFQCPFCKKTRPTIKQIMETYKDKVYYVFRDFPLSFHKQARKAAEATECAEEQKKYWEYNTLLWEKQGDQEPDKLRQYAKELGLNEKKFGECLDSDKYSSEIDKDIEEGSKAGVSGTPAYFVNGIFVSGAQPFEKFQEIIDEELQAQ